MEVRDIYLCIHYDKKIDFNGRASWIQPGDMEISYLAGTKKYAFIGFCDCGSDAGTLVFATDERDEVKSFMAEKQLKFDFRYVYNSELLDFHKNFQKDIVGQWRVVGLEGTVEIEDEYAESAFDWFNAYNRI